MEMILVMIEGYLDALDGQIEAEVPRDYQLRLKENLREAKNAVIRMKKAVDEYSLSDDYQKR